MKKLCISLLLLLLVLSFFSCKKEVSYTISFDSDGGTAFSSVEVDQGDTLNLPTPTKDHYTFAGWYLGTTRFDFTMPVSQDMTLKAKWTGNEVSVTFETNGGSAVQGSTMHYGDAYVLPPAPTKSGNDFLGWYLEPEFATRVTAETKVSNASSHTLYAKWGVSSYTVSYVMHGGTPGAIDQTVEYGALASEPSEPSKMDATFNGWMGEDGGTTAFSFASPITGDTTLYASWKYAISYDANGASSGTAPASQEKIEGVALTLDANTGTLAKTGHDLTGWNTQSDGNGTHYDVSGVYTANEKATLYAEWKIKSFTVTFDTQEGSAIEPKTVTYNGKVSKPSNPTKDGCKFLGWLENGSAYDFNTIVTGDITITASWKDHITASAGAVTLGTAFDEELMKSGCAFSGWNTRKDGSGDWYLPGNNTFSASTDLYPQWIVLVMDGTKLFGHDGGDLNHCLVLPEGITSIENNAFQGCSGLSGTLVIPESVESIGGSAYEGCSGLNGSLMIPDSVERIGNYAFSGCSGLSGSLMIPDSVKSIGESAFSGCNKLSGDLTIPDSVTSLGAAAFSDCSGFDGALKISSSVTSLGGYVFSGCSGLSGSLTIPASVTSIGVSAFSGCSGLSGNLTIPDSVESIGSFAYNNCSGFDGALKISSFVTSLGDYVFDGCSGLSGSLTIPNSVESIGDYVFSGCSGLSGSLTIPNSVKSIGESAFYKCSKLSGTLTIPSSVTSIGISVFSGCSELIDLIIPGTVKKIDKKAFQDCAKGKTLTINYKGTETQWGAIEKDISWNDGTTVALNYNYSGT